MAWGLKDFRKPLANPVKHLDVTKTTGTLLSLEMI